jgi:sugar diacid utilization regulator/GAF domain-containing protein
VKKAAQIDAVNDIACGLIALLHQGAPADEFASRLAQVDQLADDTPGKSSLVELVRMAMGVRNRLELQQQRERGMLAVIESAQDLSGHLDLTGLLRAIVSRARNLLGSQVAWLSTYHDDRDEFQVLVADGALSQNTGGMVARRDLGVASVVMSTRLPFTTPDYLHDNRFPHDAKLDDTFRDEGIAALVGAPLIWENEVIGLLFVADRYHRAYTALNVSILCTLAIHGAVALKNARAFEQARVALHKAEVARAELERHARNVQAAAEAHEQMTSLLARGASLSTLCQAIANLLGGSVLVLDEAAQVLGRGAAAGYPGRGAETYSPYGQQHSTQLAQALRQSRQVGRSVVAYEADGELCRLVAVIGGDDVLGSVLLFRQGDLDEVSVRTFERSASVIGIVLLSQERMEAAKSKSGSTLMRAIISARQDEAALLFNRAERLGIDLAKPVSLMLMEMDELKAGYVARRLGLGGALPNVVFDEIDGLLAILCGATRADELRDAICTLAKTEFGGAFRGVLSRPVAGPAEIPALYAALKRALPVLGRIGVGGHIVNQNDMALYSTLFETHDQTSRKGFLETTIGPLISHDQKRGSELTSTLLHYFDCNQNAKTTSQRLGIHVNTVRQRLASVEELLGYWGNATRALELHIALRLWSLSTPPPR